VQTFRTARGRPVFTGWPRKALAVAATLAFLGTFGGITATMINNGRLPLPGDPPPDIRARAQLLDVDDTDSMSLRRERSGQGPPSPRSDAHLSKMDTTLPDIERGDKATVDPTDDTGRPSTSAPKGGKI